MPTGGRRRTVRRLDKSLKPAALGLLTDPLAIRPAFLRIAGIAGIINTGLADRTLLPRDTAAYLRFWFLLSTCAQ